jgi:cytochrome c-type biogenesis protein CcmH
MLFALVALSGGAALGTEPGVVAGPVEHVAAPPVEFSEYVPGAARLEGRLLAPCCWIQTLDVHGSELANSLRSEIRRRLRAGESADAIEASMVARYGKRILAVPRDNPLRQLAIALSLAMGAGGIGAVLLMRRWRSRAKQSGAEGPSVSKPERDALDDRLDAELDELRG